jgi:hypothetical protein
MAEGRYLAAQRRSWREVSDRSSMALRVGVHLASLWHVPQHGPHSAKPGAAGVGGKAGQWLV